MESKWGDRKAQGRKVRGEQRTKKRSKGESISNQAVGQRPERYAPAKAHAHHGGREAVVRRGGRTCAHVHAWGVVVFVFFVPPSAHLRRPWRPSPLESGSCGRTSPTPFKMSLLLLFFKLYVSLVVHNSSLSPFFNLCVFNFKWRP